jgi:molybdate transport system ATP-binding protein
VTAVSGLDARLGLRRGNLQLDVALRARPGEMVALLGPNGAGKSTVVQALAGLIPIEQGAILCGGTQWDRPPSVWLPPERRPVGVVFQDYLLFPHMTAVDNVAYGLRARGARTSVAAERAMTVMTAYGIGGVAALRPAQLSGGQAQRVALARALVTDPDLLLLDEPLGALDVTARAAARSSLRAMLAGFRGIAVLVTHDPVDALTLADRVVVMEGGAVVQAGTTDEIAARPRSAYVADFVGLNLFRGTINGGVLSSGHGRIQVATAVVGEAFAAVHPRSVALHRAPPAGSARNAWPVRVGDIEMSADRARVQLTGAVSLVAEVTRAAVDALALGEGGEAWAEVKATAFDVYPA